MSKRRVMFTIGVQPTVKKSELKRLCKYVKEIIKQHEDVQFSRAHLVEITEECYTIEVVYYVLSKRYSHYTTAHQKILLEMKDVCDREGIPIKFATNVARALG